MYKDEFTKLDFTSKEGTDDMITDKWQHHLGVSLDIELDSEGDFTLEAILFWQLSEGKIGLTGTLELLCQVNIMYKYM